MIPLSVNLDPESGNLATERSDLVELKGQVEIAVMPHGCASGLPSVAIIATDGHGRGEVYMIQTTAALFVMAAKLILAKYPELDNG